MKPNLKDAKVVAFRERGLTSWELATRQERREPFRIMYSMRYNRPDNFHQDIYSDVVVVEKFPSISDIVRNAPAFTAKDKAAQIRRIWVRRDDGYWGAVNLNSEKSQAYPVTVYHRDDLETIVDIDSIVVLQEVD